MVKIGEVCRVLPGFAFKSSDFAEHGIPVVKIASIRDDLSVDTSDAQCLPENILTEKMRRFILRDGDIVLAMTGATAGKIGRVRTQEPLLLNQRVAKIEAITADANYIWSVLSAKKYRERFYNLAGGAAQPNLSGGQIEELEIPLPSRPIQRRIAETLMSYNDLISNNRRRIELLDLSTRLLFKEWFLRLRYPGHEHIQVVDGVPKGWSRKLLGEVAICNASSHSARSLPPEINYIDISSVAGGLITQKMRMTAEDAPGRARRRAADGDVIWSNVRPNLKQYALVLAPDDEDVFSTGFTILSANEVPFSFLYIAVTTDAFVAHLVSHTTGVSYPAVRPDDFERAKLLIPPELLLREFHDQCEPILRLAHSLDSQNKKLALARDLLLPRLMDGRIAV
jgi:type I restriction enzyme S subunit